MSQTRNKIIFLVSTIVVLGFLIFGIVFYQNKKTPSVIKQSLTLEEQKANILNQGCYISSTDTMRICRYSATQEAVPITETTTIERNKIITTLPVVHFGDLDIFKINLFSLFSNKEYQDIATKLDSNFSVCFVLSPEISQFKVMPREQFSFISGQTACTNLLSKDDNLSFGFVGTIPYPSNAQQEINIEVWQPPKTVVGSEEEFNRNLNNFVPIVRLVPAIIMQ